MAAFRDTSETPRRHAMHRLYVLLLLGNLFTLPQAEHGLCSDGLRGSQGARARLMRRVNELCVWAGRVWRRVCMWACGLWVA